MKDRDEAYLVYAAQREYVDMEYMKRREAEEKVGKELDKMVRFVVS